MLLGLLFLTWISGVRSGRWWWFVLGGLFAGLAYLTRGENMLLPLVYIVSLVIARKFDRSLFRVRWWHIALLAVTAVVVITPWVLRNYAVGGSPLTTNLQRLYFLSDFREYYAYGRPLTLQTLLASQTPAQLIGKRLFELAADFKLMYTMLDVFLPVIVFSGMVALIAARDTRRLVTLAPVLVFLGGTLVFYAILAPAVNQGGSFKKFYLSLVPLLVPIGGYFLDRLQLQRTFVWSIMIFSVLLSGANGVELTRADIRTTNNYLDYIRPVVEAANDLGDANGDGKIVMMVQDPFMFNFFGMQSVAIPMEDRDTVLEVAQRYHVDYLMMPPARPALDPIYARTEQDARFVPLWENRGYQVELYGFDFEAGT
jgi:hypothetical protein